MGKGDQRALLLGIINSGELLDKLRDDSPIGIAVDEGPDGSQGGTVLRCPRPTRRRSPWSRCWG